MLNLAQPHITLKDKLNTRFNNPTSSIDSYPERLTGEDSYRQRYDTDKGTYNLYDRYIPLNTYPGQIYQQFENTEFRKAGI